MKLNLLAMSESELIFHFFYILLCACIIYPPNEFVSLGLTIEQIFSHILGPEELHFVRYHQKRASLTLTVHGILPAIYFLIHYFQFSGEYPDNVYYQSITWKIAQNLSLTAVLVIPSVIYYWAQNDWEMHPITKNLRKFTDNLSGYSSIAGDISTEFRRQDVLRMRINSVSSLITTENWIIKTTPYFVHFAHQSDTTLNVNKSETYAIAQDTYDSIQIINIAVKPNRVGVREFEVRINALDFKTLQDKISRPITIASNIQFHRNIIERFIEVFKEQVTLNPKFRTNQVAESCFACMLAEPNIKIQKQCLDVDENGLPIPEVRRCKNCYCRPMWCVECLARWFASRQNEFERDIWLQQQCSCPLCRATFCILDVCYIEKTEL